VFELGHADRRSCGEARSVCKGPGDTAPAEHVPVFSMRKEVACYRVGAPQGRLLRLAERLLLAGPVALRRLLLHLQAHTVVGITFWFLISFSESNLKSLSLDGSEVSAEPVSCAHHVPCLQRMQHQATCLVVHATSGS
jgi:hypothetical protein